MQRRGGSERVRAGGIAALACAALVLISAGGSVAASGAASGPERPNAAKPTKLRVFLLGLPQTGNPGRFARAVSNPTSTAYRQFLTTREYRQRFAARQADRRRVRTYLAHQGGVKKLEVSFDRSMFLAVLTVAPAGGSSARGIGPPSRRLCRPARLRGRVSQISAGEVYEVGGSTSRARRSAPSGTPNGCSEATSAGTFTPNELTTAYGVDPLHQRGLGERGPGRDPELAGGRPAASPPGRSASAWRRRRCGRSRCRAR